MGFRSEAELLALGSVFLVLLVRLVWVKLRKRRAQAWPKTLATIESFEMETKDLDDKTEIVLPCFTFSYVAAGENYSGRFSLFTDGEQEGEFLAKKMVRREIEIQYDPKRPSAWYIPDKRIEGYEVEQKMSSHLMESLYPKD